MLKKHKSLLQNAAAILVLTGVGLYLLSIFEVSQTILFSIGGAVLFVVTFSVTVRITYTSCEGTSDNPDSDPKTSSQIKQSRSTPAIYSATNQHDRQTLLNRLDKQLFTAGCIGYILAVVGMGMATPILAKIRGADQVWGVSLESETAFLLIFLSSPGLVIMTAGVILMLAGTARAVIPQNKFWKWHPQIKATERQP